MNKRAIVISVVIFCIFSLGFIFGEIHEHNLLAEEFDNVVVTSAFTGP